MRRYVVYMHVAPNGKRYFGITSMSPERRWGCGSGYCHNPHFSRAIQHYGRSNIEHVVLLRGRIKSAYGFVWRYPDETNLNYKGVPE